MKLLKGLLLGAIGMVAGFWIAMEIGVAIDASNGVAVALLFGLPVILGSVGLYKGVQ